MSPRTNWPTLILLCAATFALAPFAPVKAQTQDDFASRRDKLIRTIDSLNSQTDPSVPWQYTMKLTPKNGRRVEVRMTSTFAPDTPNGLADGKTSVQTFTLPGAYTFDASKSAGSRISDMVAVHGKEYWNIGTFRTEGVAEGLGRALTNLNRLCAEYAGK
jgi:hypothetical protein